MRFAGGQWVVYNFFFFLGLFSTNFRPCFLAFVICVFVRRRHTLSRRRIIPLPQWKANSETDPEALFSKDQLVLALYPQTTCFYRALIHTPPHRVSVRNKTKNKTKQVFLKSTGHSRGHKRRTV